MIWDIIILSICGLGLALGIWHGLIKEIASVAGLLLAVYMAGLAAPAIEPYTLRVFGETGSYLIAWVIAFVVFMIAITIIATALTKILEVISLGFMNRLFGGLFGLIKYILVISLFLNILGYVENDINLPGKEERESSKCYRIVKSVVPAIFPYLKGFYEGRSEKTESVD